MQNGYLGCVVLRFASNFELARCGAWLPWGAQPVRPNMAPACAPGAHAGARPRRRECPTMHCQIFGLSEFYLGTARTREVLPLHICWQSACPRHVARLAKGISVAAYPAACRPA